uniref:Uncharacterized protein n=1 Tax=Anopheles funestus TaxID=62324 RepID=A0A4Y0BKL5_ANOFN
MFAMSLSVADTTTLAETVPSSTEERSNKGVRQQQQPITLILPTSGKLFFREKTRVPTLQPQLLPLKSFSLEKLGKNAPRSAATVARNSCPNRCFKTGNNF